MRIWGRGNSTNVRKVLWCAEELGLSYEHINAGGPFGLVNEPAYLALNPNGLVPCLDDDGFILWESNVIVRYLAARYGAGRLCPEDLQARASAEKWMDWTSLSFARPFRDVFLNLVRLPPEQRNPAEVESGSAECARLMGLADEALKNMPFLSGPQFGMGDIPLGCIAYAWYGLPVAHPSYPHLKAWYERLTQRAAYRKAVMTPLT